MTTGTVGLAGLDGGHYKLTSQQLDDVVGAVEWTAGTERHGLGCRQGGGEPQHQHGGERTERRETHHVDGRLRSAGSSSG